MSVLRRRRLGRLTTVSVVVGGGRKERTAAKYLAAHMPSGRRSRRSLHTGLHTHIRAKTCAHALPPVHPPPSPSPTRSLARASAPARPTTCILPACLPASTIHSSTHRHRVPAGVPAERESLAELRHRAAASREPTAGAGAVSVVFVFVSVFFLSRTACVRNFRFCFSRVAPAGWLLLTGCATRGYTRRVVVGG
jgi:hypothetical protein